MASVASVLVNVAAQHDAGPGRWAIAGLALGTSLAAIVNAAVQICSAAPSDWTASKARQARVDRGQGADGVAGDGCRGWRDRTRAARRCCPATALPLQACARGRGHRRRLGVLTLASMLLRVREFELSRDLVLKRFGTAAVKRLGLHSAIWATASTHFVVDAYGNMYRAAAAAADPAARSVAADGRHARDVLTSWRARCRSLALARSPIAGGRACC